MSSGIVFPFFCFLLGFKRRNLVFGDRVKVVFTDRRKFVFADREKLVFADRGILVLLGFLYTYIVDYFC